MSPIVSRSCGPSVFIILDSFSQIAKIFLQDLIAFSISARYVIELRLPITARNIMKRDSSNCLNRLGSCSSLQNITENIMPFAKNCVPFAIPNLKDVPTCPHIVKPSSRRTSSYLEYIRFSPPKL